jgi:predicted HicB family RNase H-like nuclease
VFDPSIDAFHGRIVGLQDVVTFQGVSPEELRREMAESVEDYLEFCAEVGKEPERPCRGEFLIRTTPELHRAVAVEAEASGMSLNAWVAATITSVVKENRPTNGESRQAAKAGKRRTTKAQGGSSGSGLYLLPDDVARRHRTRGRHG